MLTILALRTTPCASSLNATPLVQILWLTIADAQSRSLSVHASVSLDVILNAKQERMRYAVACDAQLATVKAQLSRTRPKLLELASRREQERC